MLGDPVLAAFLKARAAQLTGRCDFHDAGTGDRCVSRGIALTLRDPLGHLVRRTLCSQHSDWEGIAPPQDCNEASK